MALFLQDHHYRAGVLAGGYTAWQAAGLPLEPAGKDAENAASL